MKALARMHVLRDGDEKTLEWIRTNPLPANTTARSSRVP